MKTEKEKMLVGKPYKAFDSELFNERQKAKEILYEFNNLRPTEIEERNAILKELLGNTGEIFFCEPPFRCDYGYNISVDDNFFSNYNFIVIDCAKVSIAKMH